MINVALYSPEKKILECGDIKEAANNFFGCEFTPKFFLFYP